jgi:hypothetical protein
MANLWDQFSSLLPVPPGTFSEVAPKPKENGKGPDNMDENEPPKQGDKEAPAQENVQARSQMTKPLAPIESGVEECDLCGRWKSKCRICAALFCEQCSMGEAIRLSHMRRGTVICGQCAVTLEHVPNARIIPISIPELPSGPALCTDKAWKQGILKNATRIPTRPPPAVQSPAPRALEKEFSADEMDNDFKYQNLFEVLFSPDLHLLSAMFEVLPEEESGDRLLAAILRLIDRSARTEPIMKACVEMEVLCSHAQNPVQLLALPVAGALTLIERHAAGDLG